MRNLGVVYVLVNSAFENYVKIGRTTNLERRLRSLDNTSVPLPFRCVFAVEVDDENEVERLLHQAFADNRTRTTREFFQLEDWHVIRFGRETGIRTLGTLAGTTDFESVPFDHSGTSPNHTVQPVWLPNNQEFADCPPGRCGKFAMRLNRPRLSKRRPFQRSSKWGHWCCRW